MLARTAVCFSLLCLQACSKSPAPVQGPVIAQGDGVVITADELRTRLADQPISVRHAFQRSEGKKKFLEEAIRFELLARAAAQEGLADDPDVRFAIKKALIAGYRKRLLRADAPAVPDAEVRKYYDEHLDEFSRPLRVHAALIFVSAEAGQTERPARAAEARQLLDGILSAEAINANAFYESARQRSDDPETRPLGGDLGFRTREELERIGKEVSNEALALEANQTSRRVIETPRGFYLLRGIDRQPEQTRKFEEARPQIAARLAEQRKDAGYDAMLNRLRDAAKIEIDAAALEKINVPVVPGAGG